MSSVVDICNRALSKAHVSARIGSLDAKTTEARQCKLHYATCRDDALSRHPWSFARKRIEIAADATPPEFGYKNRYLLPSGYLSAVSDTGKISTGELNGYEFEIEGKYILTDAPAPLRLRYIAEVNDPSLFSPAFEVVLVLRLGAELALGVKASRDQSDKLLARYEKQLRIAARVDTKSKSKATVKSGSLMKARL